MPIKDHKVLGRICHQRDSVKNEHKIISFHFIWLIGWTGLFACLNWISWKIECARRDHFVHLNNNIQIFCVITTNDSIEIGNSFIWWTGRQINNEIKTFLNYWIEVQSAYTNITSSDARKKSFIFIFEWKNNSITVSIQPNCTLIFQHQMHLIQCDISVTHSHNHI